MWKITCKSFVIALAIALGGRVSRSTRSFRSIRTQNVKHSQVVQSTYKSGVSDPFDVFAKASTEAVDLYTACEKATRETQTRSMINQVSQTVLGTQLKGNNRLLGAVSGYFIGLFNFIDGAEPMLRDVQDEYGLDKRTNELPYQVEQDLNNARTWLEDVANGPSKFSPKSEYYSEQQRKLQRLQRGIFSVSGQQGVLLHMGFSALLIQFSLVAMDLKLDAIAAASLEDSISAIEASGTRLEQLEEARRVSALPKLYRRQMEGLCAWMVRMNAADRSPVHCAATCATGKKVALYSSYYKNQDGRPYLSNQAHSTRRHTKWEFGEQWVMSDAGGGMYFLFCEYWHSKYQKGYLTKDGTTSSKGPGEKWQIYRRGNNFVLYNDYWKGYKTQYLTSEEGASALWEIKISGGAAACS